ncbi:small integral membrane protein 12 [Ambystoma mexicanum]|uniref:small integral membrane protein 12 n=1 Tax=Ambystoma mexicanum TaxID=8296 RepID=UPI0037E7D385
MGRQLGKLIGRKSTNQEAGDQAGSARCSIPCASGSRADAMLPVVWALVRTYAPYITFPVAFVVGAVGYHLEWFIRKDMPLPKDEKSILEQREDRKLQETTGQDLTQVLSLKEKLEFTPKAVLNRNRPEKS